MWSGVIVMIKTITNWPTMSAVIAARTPGRASVDRRATAPPAGGASRARGAEASAIS